MFMLSEVVFMDFDGVIADTYSICFDILHQTQPNLSPENLRQQLDRNIFEQVSHMQDKLQVDLWSLYHEQIINQPIVDDISDTIERIATGHPLFIVASSPAADISKYLSMHKLDRFFEEIIGTETAESKQQIFHAVVAKFKIPAKESVYVTDTLGDIIEAHQNDVQPIAVTWGFHDEDKLRQGNPTAIVESPEQLSGAIEEAFDFSEEYD